MALKLFQRKNTPAPSPPSRPKRRDDPGTSQGPQDAYNEAPREAPESDPLRRLYKQGRHALILREQPKWCAHPGGAEIVDEAMNAMEQRMALVPAGAVTISQTLTAEPGAAEEDIEVQPFLLDVYNVTNARFQKFVDASGYDDLDYWPEEIWPHLIELKDQTGNPGPRFWQHGRHDAAFSDHPVTGISWYEAQAYALWIGQRLATEAEWQMAASWHIKSSADLVRRFPWGDAMDNTRCNIWSSHKGKTVPVTEYHKGGAPNHVLQLVGNVWEWTDTEFAVDDDKGRPVIGEMPMHVVRGGAFDTFFEVQATSHFRTGQLALARSYNTGFRCAMDLDQAPWITGSNMKE